MRATHLRRAALALSAFVDPSLSAQLLPIVDARVVWTTPDNPSAIISRAARFAVDATGNVYYPEPSESAIYVFDSLGTYVTTIGRKGSGPGEFQGICCAAFDPKGRLWARDAGNGRYNVFTLNGLGRARPAFQVKMAHGDSNLWTALYFNAQGWLYDLASKSVPGNPPQQEYVRLVVDTTGFTRASRPLHPPTNVMKPYTVTTSAKGQTSTRYFYQPYGASSLRAEGPRGDVAQASGAQYAITWSKDDQSVRYTINRAVTGPALAPAETKRAEQELQKMATETQANVSALPFGVPDHKPALRALEFDSQGRLWVERSTALGTPRESDVYDQRGKLAFTVVWPALRGMTFTGAARGNDVWVVAEDKDDVPRIVRLKLTRRS